MNLRQQAKDRATLVAISQHLDFEEKTAEERVEAYLRFEAARLQAKKDARDTFGVYA